jgi:hypothetical protein
MKKASSRLERERIDFLWTLTLVVVAAICVVLHCYHVGEQAARDSEDVLLNGRWIVHPPYVVV